MTVYYCNKRVSGAVHVTGYLCMEQKEPIAALGHSFNGNHLVSVHQCIRSAWDSGAMDYSKWKNIGDSDDEAHDSRNEGILQITATKEAADRAFDAIHSGSKGAGTLSACLQMYSRVVRMIDQLPPRVSAETDALRGSCLLNMAAIHTELGNWQQVVDSCDAAVKYIRHYKCYYMKAVAFNKLGSREQAVNAIHRALKLATSDTAVEEIAEMQQFQQRMQAQLLGKVEEDKITLANAALKTGDYQRAAEHFTAALADPQLAAADKQKVRRTLSECYERLGDISAALSVLEDAAEADSSTINQVTWLYRAASLAYEKARDVETASRLHRNVCNILGAAIDLYQLSDRSLRSEFSSADLDGDRVLDEAIYELDSEGNLEPFGKSQWGEDVTSQEKYAVLLACSSAALGALQLKQQDPVAAIGVLRPAVSFLKGRLQRQGISLGESWARIQPLRNPPNELHHLQAALCGLSDGFALQQQWELATRAAKQACVACTLLGRTEKRASMQASLGHMALTTNQPAQTVVEHWWDAVRDYQALHDSRKAAELLLRIGELLMKDAKVEPFQLSRTAHESASSAFDAFKQAASELKRVRGLMPPSSEDRVLAELMLEENARFNAGLCCLDNRQGSSQLELALDILAIIEEHPGADKRHVQLRTADVKYHLAVRTLAARELETAQAALDDCIHIYNAVGQRSREKEAWTLLAFVRRQSGDMAGSELAVERACALCVGPVEDPVAERERILKLMSNYQASK